MKGLVIAGTKSGCGKTTIALGLMAALTKRGLKVAPFKVGPDFIDPGHHTRVTGVTSRNLDGWMLPKEYNLKRFYKAAVDAEIAVVEGVMGLFDGYDGKSEAGSTAQMAKWLGLPVILIVDASSMARSAAAVVLGFENFDKDLMFAGAIFNNLGSPRHYQYLKEALNENVRMPCRGGMIYDERISIPERHLGLVTRQDHALSDEDLNRLANMIENSIDMETLLDRLPDIPSKSKTVAEHFSDQIQDRIVRIGVAQDNAFCFYYQDNLDLLEANGAETVFFSPINDHCLPEPLDGLYFGGGYPELFAEALSKNVHLREQIKESCLDGMPIYGECGGFMYLCEELCNTEGQCFPMTGCFAFTSKMFTRLKALGYREITLMNDTVIGRSGQVIRGHEFHYSELVNSSPDVARVYRISDRLGMDKAPDGYQVNRTLGSYNHLHFGSQPQAAKYFVDSCLVYKREREKRS